MPIDRRALVARHAPTVTACDPALPLSLGNGEFAFNADPTGLQTFYGNTLAQWGWHSDPPPDGLHADDLPPTPYAAYGRSVGYPTRPNGQEALYAWLRANPHRLNLGRIGLSLDGAAPASPAALGDLRQTLDLWTGVLTSRFTLAGQPVAVTTCCHPERDAVACRIVSPLVASGRLTAAIDFPAAAPAAVDGADWDHPDRHRTTCLERGARHARLLRTLDADVLTVDLRCDPAGTRLSRTGAHGFAVAGEPGAAAIAFSAAFAPGRRCAEAPAVDDALAASARHWAGFWSAGGAVDLSASRDPRWRELERRIVLSQYLMAVHGAGSLPPQESGLANNSGWHGKFHLEMHWWHGVHFALWERWPLFARSLDWYQTMLPAARRCAARQGYRGARWPKMVGPDGREAPSPCGPLLLWQQPHPLYYAELAYRRQPGPETLERWAEIVAATAEFMAAIAEQSCDPGEAVCHLGPPLMTVPENSEPTLARDPTFELTYWRFGLRLAQTWRERQGLARDPAWDRVLQRLAPAPMHQGLYLQQAGMLDTFTAMNWEHPSLVGALGMLPGDGIDPAAMRATVRQVMATWQWDRCWGWDFPMTAMAAARCGEPQLAVEALLHPSPRNAIAANGFSSGGPYPYFPANGGLLTAVALMAAGWDGAPDRHAPGFPADGGWSVAWEGLRPAL